MDRSNHYEAAVEAYLLWHRLCHVAVDEARRPHLDGGTVKNLDFVVYGESGSRLVVDVKGRRFPSGSRAKAQRSWQCWVEREDVTALERWAVLFGSDYRGLFLFTYWLQPGYDLPEDTDDLWTWRGRRYLLRAIPVDEYRLRMKVRSPRWETVDLPAAAFRELVRPFHFYTHPEGVPEPVDELPL